MTPKKDPEYQFFWDRHVDRALSKLMNSFSNDLEKVEGGAKGDVNITMSVERIKINKSSEGVLGLCLSCGSTLTERECENCFTMMIGHKMGWCYFVIDHFRGKDYSVVFYNEAKFNFEELSADIGREFEIDIIGPYVTRGSDTFLVVSRVVKARKHKNYKNV